VRINELQVIEGGSSGRTVPTAGPRRRSVRGRAAPLLNLSVVLYRDGPAVRLAVRDAVRQA
jgi:hypothetical protein